LRRFLRTSASMTARQAGPAPVARYCKGMASLARAPRTVTSAIAERATPEARSVLGARDATRRPVARQTGLERDQCELLARLWARVSQELGPEPVAARERALDELPALRDVLEIAELHCAQALNRPRLQREKEPCVIDALSAQRPCAMHDRETQRVACVVAAA